MIKRAAKISFIIIITHQFRIENIIGSEMVLFLKNKLMGMELVPDLFLWGR